MRTDSAILARFSALAFCSAIMSATCSRCCASPSSSLLDVVFAICSRCF